jgi:hypothetical protein
MINALRKAAVPRIVSQNNKKGLEAMAGNRGDSLYATIVCDQLTHVPLKVSTPLSLSLYFDMATAGAKRATRTEKKGERRESAGKELPSHPVEDALGEQQVDGIEVEEEEEERRTREAVEWWS